MATINVLLSNSMRAVMDELVPRFESTSGHKVVLSYDPAKLIMERLARGETPDVVICGSSAIDGLIKEGKVVSGSNRLIARCGVGLAVRAGAPKPDIGTVEAFKLAVLGAKSVAYTQQGASGIHFSGLIDRLGIAEDMKSKGVRQPGGLVGELVAAGKAEVAIQQIPELMAVPGVDLVGPLPPEIQATTTSAGGVFATSSQKEAARAFLDFLGQPASAGVMKAKGLEPVKGEG